MDTDLYLRALAATNEVPAHLGSADEHPASLLADERVELVAKIRAIPIGQLPDQRARAALIALAQAGAHMAVYPSTTADGQDGTTIWLEPSHPSLDGRISCVRWMRSYRQDASERALRQLLPLLWQRRAEQQALAAGRVEVPLIYRTAVCELVHDLEQRVALIWCRMMQAEGVAGVRRFDAIVCDVAADGDTTAVTHGETGRAGRAGREREASDGH